MRLTQHLKKSLSVQLFVSQDVQTYFNPTLCTLIVSVSLLHHQNPSILSLKLCPRNNAKKTRKNKDKMKIFVQTTTIFINVKITMYIQIISWFSSKGEQHENFWSRVFHGTSPHGPPISKKFYFCIFAEIFEHLFDSVPFRVKNDGAEFFRCSETRR